MTGPAFGTNLTLLSRVTSIDESNNRLSSSIPSAVSSLVTLRFVIAGSHHELGLLP